MALIFGMPSGITDDMEMVLAAIQTAFGRADAIGKWTHVAIDNSYLTIDGTASGNSWTLGSLTNQYSYTIIGNTMILSWYFTSAHLTINVSVGDLYLLIPDGYTALPSTGNNGQFHSSAGWGVNGGTYFAASGRSGSPDTRHINIQKLNLNAAPYFVTDTGSIIAGQLAFEIVPRT